MKAHSRIVQLTRITTLALLLAPWTTQAALVVSGNDAVLPGGLVSLSIELDAALDAEIDSLILLIETNNPGATGDSALAGPLLSGGSFVSNPSSGEASMVFVTTLSALGPGTLASWTFAIDLLVGQPQPLEFRATLQTFNLEDELTAELISDVKSVAVVPVPPAFALLAAPLALVMARSTRRKRATHFAADSNRCAA